MQVAASWKQIAVEIEREEIVFIRNVVDIDRGNKRKDNVQVSRPRYPEWGRLLSCMIPASGEKTA
jgi:hypothetical protein